MAERYEASRVTPATATSLLAAILDRRSAAGTTQTRFIRQSALAGIGGRLAVNKLSSSQHLRRDHHTPLAK